MVALHNRRLSDRDIWPDILWDDKMWHAKRDEFEAKLRAEGLVDHHLFFAISRAMEAYAQQFPKLKERQQVRARLFPMVSAPAPPKLTEEEIAYLIERLAGVNDPVGQSILKKITPPP